MSKFYSMHKNLAIRPIKRQGIKPIIKGGIAIMAQSTEMCVSELLFDANIDNEFIMKGSLVAFKGSSEAAPWNGTLYNHDGVEFVLAPYSEVIFIAPPTEGEDAQ